MDYSPATQVWYAIQAWKLQKRIKFNYIRHDSIVNKVFNQCIKDEVVSRVVFEKEKKNIEN